MIQRKTCFTFFDVQFWLTRHDLCLQQQTRTATLRVKWKKEQKVDDNIIRTSLIHLQLFTIPDLSLPLHSSSAASCVSPVHTEQAKPSSSPLWRYPRTGAPPASALWIFSGCVAAEVEGWGPLSARGHAAVPPEGQRSTWVFACCSYFRTASVMFK